MTEVPDAVTALHLNREFGARRVVDDVTLRVRPGEIFGLLGPNGAGKTTIIRMLTTLLAPTSGRALVCGLDVRRDAAEARRRIGYVPQEKGVRHLLTGRESLEIEADLHHVPRRLRRQRVDEVLRLAGLLADAENLVSRYSGGMQKRLDLACGLLHRPDVLILDEPTLGLDVRARHRLWQHVQDLRGRGSTILLATHYLDEADRLCDRIAILDGGRVVITATPAELKQTAGAEVIRASTPEPDRLWAVLDGRDWNRRAVVADGGQITVFVDDAAAAMPHLMRAAVLADVTVTRVSYDQPTLDDAFLLNTAAEPDPA